MPMDDALPALIVEDDALIGLMLVDMFDALDLPLPVHASSVAEALEQIDQKNFCGAFVDVNLGEEKGWPVAEALANRNIPFVFTTGGGVNVPPVFKDVPMIMKPFRIHDIEEAVQAFG